MDETDESELDRTVEEHDRVLNALYHDAGIVASEVHFPPTPEELTEEAALAAFLKHLTAGH